MVNYRCNEAVTVSQRGSGTASQIDQSARCRAHSNRGRSKIRVLIKRSTSWMRRQLASREQTEPRRERFPIEGDYNGVTSPKTRGDAMPYRQTS